MDWFLYDWDLRRHEIVNAFMHNVEKRIVFTPQSYVKYVRPFFNVMYDMIRVLDVLDVFFCFLFFDLILSLRL